MKDIYNSVALVSAVLPQVATTTAESAAIDLQGFESALAVYHVGQSADTLSATVKITLSLTECDTSDGTFTAVAAGDYQGTLALIDAAAEDEAAFKVGYLGSKRYIKAGFTFAGTHATGTEVSAVVLKGHARHNGTLV
jgi:hypothetical protein